MKNLLIAIGIVLFTWSLLVAHEIGVTSTRNEMRIVGKDVLEPDLSTSRDHNMYCGGVGRCQ
jgi:hypothetical protein